MCQWLQQLHHHWTTIIDRNKRADTVLKGFEAIIKNEKFRYFLSIIYCDEGTEFDNKIFTNPKKVNFKVQFTSDRRKAVYAERASRTIRRSLEQYYIGGINEAPSNYKDIIQNIVQGHNESSSLCAPLVLNPNGMTANASPREVIEDKWIMNKMQSILFKQGCNQYETNISKKSYENGQVQYWWYGLLLL